MVVPAGVQESRSLRYVMSWELYRALEGKSYTGADKLADDAYENTQKVQLLWWDKQGFGHIAWTTRAQRDAYQKRERDLDNKRFREQAWTTYEWLQRENAFTRKTCDLLYEMRKQLEALDERDKTHP